jgi:hypothetical protein
MKRIAVIPLVLMAALILSCAAGLQGFKEPTSDNTMLVVGQVLIEDNYYTEETAVYKASIEVAVMGKTSEGKRLGLWANTDENGYFSIADAPKGEYVIKGVRALIGRGSLVNITNRLRLSTDVYTVSGQSTMLFNGEYFPFEPVGRIQSLQHNIFRLDRMSSTTNQVNHMVSNFPKDIKLVDGEILTAGPVEEYFIQKHPASAWVSFLTESAKVARYKR